MNKTRAEQDKEFRDYFSHYADSGCKICGGTGKDGWITELKMYKLCLCVMENVREGIEEISKIRERLVN